MPPMMSCDFPYLKPVPATAEEKGYTDFPLSPSSISNGDLGNAETPLPDEDREATNLQECWDENIANQLNLQNGYVRVYVLIIKWNDTIDQLKVQQEVNDLANVFQNTFGFEVEEYNIPGYNSQLALVGKINSWASEYNNNDNLLIVYYAGHGLYHKKSRQLSLSPTNEGKGPKLLWNVVEQCLLTTVTADVLLIMDCCFASDLMRNQIELGRTFEMLAASAIGDTTPQPGPDSFTRCLIKHLEALADSCPDGFTTRDIEDCMKKERGSEAPQLWRRIPGSSRHIRLRKLMPQESRSGVPAHETYLSLGFYLEKKGISKTQIEGLTKLIPEVFKEIGAPLADARWLTYHKTGRFHSFASYLIKNRHNLPLAISPISDKKRSITEAGFTEDYTESKGPSTSHKVSRTL